MRENDNKTMKILNNLTTSFIISKIKYPFIKIASLFERVFIANRIQIVENPKYLSTPDTLRSSKISNSSDRKSLTSDISIDENDYQDIDKYKKETSLVSKENSEHLYTRINKTGNGEIDRYLPSNQDRSNNQNTTIHNKSGQIHPFLKKTKEVEMVAPPVPTKNRPLIQEVIKRDASHIQFPSNSKEMRLAVLKGFELFI